MLIVTSLNGQTEALTDYKNLQVRERVNDEHSLSFTLFPTNRNEHSYPLLEEESIVEYDGQEYRVKKLRERSRGKKYFKEAKALHVFFDLIEEYQYLIIGGTKTFHDLLSFALNGTGFTFEIVGQFPTKLVFNYGENNALKLVQQALEVFEAEVELQNRHLVFKKQIGRITDFQFRYKHNIKAINRDIDTTKLSTVIKGYGRGFEITYTSPYVSIYGERHAEPIRDDRYTDQNSMLERLKRELKDKPNIALTIEFAELKKAGYPFEEVQKGDEVFLIYEPLGIDFVARVLDYNRHPEEPLKSEVTLSNFRQSITDIMSLMSNEIQDVQRNNEINRSEIRQTNEKIELEVVKLVGEIEENRSLISQTATEIRLEVSQIDTRLGSAESQISIQAGQIETKVSQTDYNGNTIASLINQTATTIKIQASKIELTGYVTVTSLSTPGQTTIDGGNITTGTISANRIATNIAQVNSVVNIGDFMSSGTKEIRFRNTANITSYSDDLNLNAQSITLDASSIFIGIGTFSTTYLRGNVNLSNATLVGMRSAGSHNHGIQDGTQIRCRNSQGVEFWATWSAAGGHVH